MLTTQINDPNIMISDPTILETPNIISDPNTVGHPDTLPSTSIATDSPSTSTAADTSNSRKPWRYRKERPMPQIKIYPFWTEVLIKAKGGPVVGEGIVVPGFQLPDQQVPPFGGVSRKIFVKEVYECNKDDDLIPGAYSIRSFALLTPKYENCVEGIGSLVNIEVCKDFRRVKHNSKKEELCAALACQCPTSKEVEWVQCGDVDCKKWYHIHCVGYISKQQLPEEWFCEVEKYNENDNFFSKKGEYEHLNGMLPVLETVVEDHLRMVVTNEIGSVRNTLFHKHERKEREYILRQLSTACNIPFSEELEEDLMDIVTGMIVPPGMKWDEKTKSAINYATDVLIPEAYVRFIMEVEKIPRHVAELVLFNWKEQVPEMLLQYQRR